MIDEKFVILALIFNLLGGISYMSGVVKGTVKPNRVTWLLWGVVPMVAFFAQISEGVGWPALMTFAAGFFPFIIFGLSFLNKKSEWKLSRFDIFCGVLSVVGILLWMITKDGVTAIMFSIAADGMAGLPTLVKSFYKPETEDYRGYLAPLIGAVITLLTLKNWSFAYIGFPVYILLITTILVLLVRFKLGKIILRA